MGKLDEKVSLKYFAKVTGLPEPTVRENVNRLVACDEIVILSVEMQ